MSVTARRVAVLGALLGIFASAYLLIDYVWGSGICLTGSGCDTVRLSPYAHPFGVPMPLLGLAYYTFALGLASPVIPGLSAGSRTGLLAAWSLVGVLVMAGLTLIELAVIHALCSWCLLSALASILLAAGGLGTWRSARQHEEVPPGRSARNARRARDARVEADRAVRRFTLVSSGMTAIAFAALLIAPVLAGQSAPVADAGASDRPRRGNGPVQVVVFSDFQCPACAAAAPALSEVAASQRVTLTYRFFPLTAIHANARAAALAALAADAQGRFWQFHDALFARQQEWADLPPDAAESVFADIAASIGLDTERWRADIGSAKAASAIDADLRAAQDLDLRGTPTIFIDGVQYRGALDTASILGAVGD
jgi:protein-disulfide isomerase/uncharacterized membrane protein